MPTPISLSKTTPPRIQDMEQMKQKAASTSVGLALLLTILKLAAGLATNSLAILSEALHSGIDLIASALTFGAVRIAKRPADTSHPYGHARIENLSALACSALLYVVCFFVAHEGCERLLTEEPVQPSLVAIAIMCLSLFIDCNRVRTLRKVAKSTQSQALEADCMHFATDILASVAVLCGLTAVFLSTSLDQASPWYPILHHADTLAAGLVCVIIFIVSTRMVLKAANVLLDACPKGLKEKVATTISATKGVCELSQLRLRSAGQVVFIDAILHISQDLSLMEAHAISMDVEAKIHEFLPKADITLHLEPAP